MLDINQIKLIIFDWNGVLAKGKAPYIFPVKILNGFLKTDVSTNEVFRIDGTDWISELKKLGINIDNEKNLKLISERMFDYSRENGLIGLYDWVEKKIPHIAKNKLLAILTNNSLSSVEHGLNGMGDHFRSIKGWQNVPALKPHPGGILSICQELGIEPAKTLMVGDSEEDRVAAERAGAMSYIIENSGQCPDFLNESQKLNFLEAI
jgi:phosphoglycolate phosphatase